MISIFGKKSSTIENEVLLNIKETLQMKLNHSSTPVLPQLTNEECKIIELIQNETVEWNVNNVTRTKAYLDFYLRHPEIHWSFLAHMVSRNGGWNMTDLKGEFLPKLLTERDCTDYFLFLERGNWLIFQDVFPQLLLYEKSKEYKTPLFHLLPFFHVSIFMEECWANFWNTGNRSVLTAAMIVNEQSFLDKALLRDEQYNKILNTIGFGLQELMSMNHIVFPITTNDEVHLIGQILDQFTSTHERISLGKRLYALLFSNEDILIRAVEWARTTSHTGSRKDYWPHLFKDIKETVPGRLYNPQVKGCNLKPGADPLYSPQLQFAWKNIIHTAPVYPDWFGNVNVVDYLVNQIDDVDGEIQHAYCKTIEKLAFTIFAKKAVFLRKE